MIVVAQPNNPTGEHFAQSRLRRLAQRCELLVIDAAFGDVLPTGSLLDVEANVVVLRSKEKYERTQRALAVTRLMIDRARRERARPSTRPATLPPRGKS